MKDLFRNRFPFVEQEDSELIDDQKKIKRVYETTYKLIQKAEEVANDRLREIHKDVKRNGRNLKR